MATSSSSLVLCLIISSLIAPSTSNPLSQVCIKSKNPRFCLEVFGLNPHRSPHELTQEALNLAVANASGTATKIDIFLDRNEDGNLKVIYSLCLNYYQAAVDVLKAAEEFLIQGQYSNVNTAGNIVEEDASNCENTFKKVPGNYVSTLTKDNENLGFLGSIVVAAADILSNSTSAKN